MEKSGSRHNNRQDNQSQRNQNLNLQRTDHHWKFYQIQKRLVKSQTSKKQDSFPQILPLAIHWKAYQISRSRKLFQRMWYLLKWILSHFYLVVIHSRAQKRRTLLHILHALWTPTYRKLPSKRSLLHSLQARLPLVSHPCPQATKRTWCSRQLLLIVVFSIISLLLRIAS